MKLACGKEHRDDPHRESSPALSAIDSRDLDFRLSSRLGKQDRGRSPLFHKEKNLPALLHRIEHSAQTNRFGHLYHRLFHGENPPFTKKFVRRRLPLGHVFASFLRERALFLLFNYAECSIRRKKWQI